MSNTAFKRRFSKSAKDFEMSIQPALEKCLAIKIFPVETLHSSELAVKLDQSGIDAFTYDEGGNPRALASRMCYQRRRAKRPLFTFRYALWDEQVGAWDCNREFYRKLNTARNPENFVLFPHLHVESYTPTSGSGIIEWSFAARTKEIIEFAEANLEDPKVVNIYEPKRDEPRKVIEISVKEFAKYHQVIEVCGKLVKFD